MVNIICAIGNKDIVKYLQSHKEINVLTVIKKREQIINRVSEFAPHVLVVSKDLSGRTPIEKILLQLRTNFPDVKIVFLYGASDTESKSFLDFLVRNGIYNFIVGGVNETLLDEAIFLEKTESDVSEYIIPFNSDDVSTERIDNIETTEKNQSVIAPKTEKETVYVKQLFGSYKIGVASLYERAGCTHLSLTLAKYFSERGISTGVITSLDVYGAIKSYYEIKKDVLCVKGIEIYSAKSQIAAAAENKILIYDVGADCEDGGFDKMIMINPLAVWEQDKLLKYIYARADKSSEYEWFVYPANSEYAAFADNMKTIGCRTYQKGINPDWYVVGEQDTKSFDDIFDDIVTLCPKQPKKGRKTV